MEELLQAWCTRLGLRPDEVRFFTQRRAFHAAAGRSVPKRAIGFFQWWPHELSRRPLLFVDPNGSRRPELTLVHELLHLREFLLFRAGEERPRRCGTRIDAEVARLTGVPVEEQRRLQHVAPSETHRYRCPKCGLEYRRYRRLGRPASCGLCGGRRYDPRYRLLRVRGMPTTQG